MRYGAYFAAKLAVAGGVLYGLLMLLNSVLPQTGGEGGPLVHGPEILANNFAFMLWFLLCAGALYLVVYDQIYRCRVCLRRLRMPIGTGSWGFMLQLGRPRVEYICPYGHGTLKQEELQISGLENPKWTPNSDDIWEELCAASKDSDKEP